jgi:hypothetical protein
MATVSVSSLFMVGHQAAKYCRATLAFISPSLRTGSSLLSYVLMKVVEVDYGRTASSTIRALSDARPSAGLLFCLAFNILIITGVAVLCISGHGFATGLSIVVLALAPTLMLLNIGLSGWIKEEQRPNIGLSGWIKEEHRPSLLRATSTNTASQHSETLDEKYPSIVPKRAETALDEKAQPQGETAKVKPQID